MFVALGVGTVAVGLATLVWRRPRTSHTTRVPVDDFVVGDLPMICVDTGEHADGMVDFETDDSRFQWWMIILVLLGPVGWILIALIYGLSSGPGRVGGVLPMTSGALESHNQMAKVSARAWLVPIAGFVAGALISMISTSHWTDTLGAVLTVIGLLGGFALLVVMRFLANKTRVSAELDATTRWIELRNVHPDFAAAVNRKVRDNHRARDPNADSHRLDF